MSPEKGLLLLSTLAICGFITEALGTATYLGARAYSEDITVGFILALVGFVFFASAAVVYKKLRTRVYGK